MKNRRFRPVVWVLVAVVPLAGLQQAVGRDCNLNGVPDDCDANCGLAGCLQYACGRSDDIDGNGVPDECEGAPAIGTFTTTTDFTTLGTLINLDDSVPGQLSRSELPRPMPNLWVAASNRGTIVRINTEPGDALGDVVGEYFTAPEGRGKNPSRISVNLDGEVWVSNRDEGSQFGFGSITRLGVLNGGTLMPQTACEPDNRATFAPPFVYNTCVDRNGDGMITTSNGLIPLPWAYEDTNPPQFGTVDTAEDECIISYVPVTGRSPGHIAVNKDNNVWVGGNFRNNTFDLVDGDTGAILETFDVGMGGHGGIIACDDVLWSVSTTGLPGVFRYDTNFGIDDIACCELAIRIDSNSDGVIDDNDAPDGNLASMFIPINYDDDDFDGTPDFENEYPVIGEDNLREVQLFVPCQVESPGSWWSVSWIDPDPDGNPATETIRVWRFPDKSDGDEFNPVLGQPLVSGELHYDEWPPPAPLWIEAGDFADGIEISFAIHIEPPGGARSVPFDDVARFEALAACRRAAKGLHVGVSVPAPNVPAVDWVEDITGAGVSIEKCPVTLCAEGMPGETAIPAMSAAWVSVALFNTTPPNAPAKWALIGYHKRRHGLDPDNKPGVIPAPFPIVAGFIEVLGGPNYPTQYYIRYAEALPTGTHTYSSNQIQINGIWEFFVNGVPHEDLPKPPATVTGWLGRKGNHIQWSGEIWNVDDQLVGNLITDACEFRDCQVGRNGAALVDEYFRLANFFRPPANPITGFGWSVGFITNQCSIPNELCKGFATWDNFP